MNWKLFVFHLIIQIILIFISSLNEYCLIICFILHLLIVVKERSRSELYSNHYYSSLFHVFIHYLMFTLSYAEILPWESVIVIGLFLWIIYYHIKLNKLTNKTQIDCCPFVKCKEENNSSVKVLILKCVIMSMCYYLYTLQLCLTTICTPSMYFNWFLIIKNCRYTYSNLHSSYTLSGGIILSLTWSLISISTLIENGVR